MSVTTERDEHVATTEKTAEKEQFEYARYKVEEGIHNASSALCSTIKSDVDIASNEKNDERHDFESAVTKWNKLSMKLMEARQCDVKINGVQCLINSN